MMMQWKDVCYLKGLVELKKKDFIHLLTVLGVFSKIKTQEDTMNSLIFTKLCIRIRIVFMLTELMCRMLLFCRKEDFDIIRTSQMK